MSSPNPPHDVWSRLRAYCASQAQKYPPLTDKQAHDLEQHGIFLPPSERQHVTSIGNGFIERPEVICYPPATEEQLRATEEQLGYLLPPDLRRLYAEVANGGIHLGPVQVFLGAIGGCGEYADVRPDGRTIEAFANDKRDPSGMPGWQMHPRIEEALLRHPGRYIIADSLPESSVWIGQDSEISVAIDLRTGWIYSEEWLGELVPDEPGDDPACTGSSFFNQLMCIRMDAPSLSVWFARWLDEPWRLPPTDRGELQPEMVETNDLPDPDVVWRGFYRPGLAKRLQQGNGERADTGDT